MNLPNFSQYFPIITLIVIKNPYQIGCLFQNESGLWPLDGPLHEKIPAEPNIMHLRPLYLGSPHEKESFQPYYFVKILKISIFAAKSISIMKFDLSLFLKAVSTH